MRDAIKINLKTIKKLPKGLTVVRESKEIGMDAIELAGKKNTHS